MLLIFVGGLVTNTGSALAVPDWPTTFGHNMFLFPWSRMIGGIFYEHAHRLIGSGVGLLTIALAIALWLAEPRAWARALGVVAVAAVIVQGVLGGMRVVLLERGLAIIHGCFAQAFLTLIVSLAVVTSQWWSAAPAVRRSDMDANWRASIVLLTPLVYMQIDFGALLTHQRYVAPHLFAALGVVVCVGVACRHVFTRHGDCAALRRPARGLLILLAMQLLLGLLTFVTRFTILGADIPPAATLAFATTHRLVGALMLATSATLTLRALRVLRVAGGVVPCVAGCAR